MLSWEHTPDITPMQCCRAWVEIDLDALRHNVRALKALLGDQDLMAVVKADAYGHGAVTVAKTALEAGATWLGVATVPEGIELRQAGIPVPIMVMGAVNSLTEVQAMGRWQLQPTLVNPKQALMFSEGIASTRLGDPLGKHQRLPVHLKLDTGMSRLGFAWEQAVEFYQFVAQLPHLAIASVYSHLATADDPDPTVMQQQQQRFEAAIAQLKTGGFKPPKLHLANSAATLVGPDLHYDMVRVGLALYGLYPALHLRDSIDLRPVLQVKARITHLKAIAAGTGVSYGHRFIAQAPMRIAVVGIGYADGVPRLLSDRLSVLVQGQSARQLGAITMDQMMIDVTHLPQVQEGDTVTLIGQSAANMESSSHSAEAWANLLGTISWEILCGFKHRLPRITLHERATATAIQQQSRR
ncbi:MAG: alanine racemase [Cyanobacteria bacterium P01_C01_bin.73]